MYYDGYHFWGMHVIWWCIWTSILFWIFATPLYVPGQQKKKDSPLDILQRRYANGEIKMEQYITMKEALNTR